MFTVTTIDDALVEGDEIFTVTITEVSLPSGVSIRAATATGTINEDDTAEVSIANASAGEGEVVEFTVSLSAQASSDVRLSWSTADDTAMAPGDYTAVSSGTVTIDAGEITNTFMVTTIDDALTEGGETFTVTIVETSLPPGVTLGDATATGTITDDDDATVSLLGSPTGIEPEPGVGGRDLTFPVGLSAALSADVILNWSVTPGTADLSDIVAASGTVTILAGQRTTTFTVELVDDDIVEESETFTVTITENSFPAGVSLGFDNATGVIERNDPGLVTIAAGAPATEGDDVTFTVSTLHRATLPVNVIWSTTDGTAIAPGDYTAVSSGMVTVPANMTTATFTVATVDDANVEGDETFTVTIAAGSNLPPQVSLSTRADEITATGTITDGDTAEVSVANASATEGEAVEFTVSLSEEASSDVVLNWSTADETAVAGADYTAQTNGTVTIDAGDDHEHVHRWRPSTTTLLRATRHSPSPLLRTHCRTGVTLGDATATGTIIDEGRATASIAGMRMPPRARRSRPSR